MQVYTIETRDGTVRAGTRTSRAPAAGEIQVRVRAVSLNFRDLILARGRPGRAPVSGVIACSDGAGVVTAIGPGVDAFRVGDRVCGTFFEEWESGPLTPAQWARSRGGGVDGMLAEEVLLGVRGAVAIPAHLSFEEGACLPCAAVTAWHALVGRAALKPGQSVLLLGTGGVSTFGLQIARAAGARVIVTSGSDEKLERARGLGAHAGVNYRSHADWARAVLELTGGAGVDVTLEVGGAATLRQSLAAARMGGTIVVIGALDDGPITLHPSDFFMKSLTVHGVYVGSTQMFRELNQFLAATGLRPVIDRVFPFAEAPAAYAHLATASHVGKLVIALD